jgi:hypothetical protein
MTDFTKQVAEAAEQVKASMPKVSFNANGYEIRTKVLEMAKDHEWSDFHAKFQGWESSATRDPKTGEIVTKVAMPVVPGVDQVLKAAEKFYAFVNGNK